MSCSGMLTLCADPAGRELDDRRHADADRARVRRRAGARSRRELLDQRVLRAAASVVHELRLARARRPRARATAIFVPPTSMPMNWSLIASSAAAAASSSTSSVAGARAHVRGRATSGPAGRRTRARPPSALSAPVTRNTTSRAALSAGSVSVMRGTCGSMPASSGTPTTSRRRSSTSGLPGNSDARVRVRARARAARGPSAGRSPSVLAQQRLVGAGRRVGPELALHPHAPRAALLGQPRRAARSSAMREVRALGSSGGTQRSSLNQTVAPLQSASRCGGELVGALAASSRR